MGRDGFVVGFGYVLPIPFKVHQALEYHKFFFILESINSLLIAAERFDGFLTNVEIQSGLVEKNDEDRSCLTPISA